MNTYEKIIILLTNRELCAIIVLYEKYLNKQTPFN
jgi:hypothetical protein